jgi:hypothetical protein
MGNWLYQLIPEFILGSSSGTRPPLKHVCANLCAQERHEFAQEKHDLHKDSQYLKVSGSFYLGQAFILHKK